MQKTKSDFELLRAKNIIEILDGDRSFGEIETASVKGSIKISLPYLSGPMLCEISRNFGLPATYQYKGVAKSRWVYLDDLLKYCIDNQRVSDLLCFLFSKEQFVDKLRGYTPDVIESAYQKIVKTVIDQINGALFFGGHELVKLGNQFVVRKSGELISVAAPAVKTIDRAYIVSLSERALQDVTDGNYDSAITKSRTLLEEVFCYVIEKKCEKPSESGDVGKLYQQVKSLYNMHQNKDLDKRINGLLSGLEKILSAIADMRNKGSDSHGVGLKRITISSHHARLFVNSATTMADFVLSVSENQSSEPDQTPSE